MEALSIPLLQALVSNPYLAKHSQPLALNLAAVLERRRAKSSGSERLAHSVSSTFELHAFNNDGRQKRSQVSGICAVSKVVLQLKFACNALANELPYWLFNSYLFKVQAHSCGAARASQQNKSTNPFAEGKHWPSLASW